MKNIFDFGLILIMICYALLNGIGSYCLKIGLDKIEDFEITIKKFIRNIFSTIFHLLKVPIIFVGVVLFLSGFLIYQYALSIYDLSIVKPLTNLNLVVIFILGFILLKERITKREIMGIAAMISGLILVSMFVSEKSTELNFNLLIIITIIYISICVFFINITFIKRDKKYDEYFLSLASAILFGLGVIFNNAIYVYGTSPYTLEFFLYNPFLYLLIISYFFAVILELSAYSGGRLVMIASIINIIGVVLPVIGAIFIFGEELIVLFDGALIFPLSLLKLIGILLIIVGTLLIYPKVEKMKESALEEL